MKKSFFISKFGIIVDVIICLQVFVVVIMDFMILISLIGSTAFVFEGLLNDGLSYSDILSTMCMLGAIYANCILTTLLSCFRITFGDDIIATDASKLYLFAFNELVFDIIRQVLFWKFTTCYNNYHQEILRIRTTIFDHSLNITANFHTKLL